jgi:hypothetical protein
MSAQVSGAGRTLTAAVDDSSGDRLHVESTAYELGTHRSIIFVLRVYAREG